MKQPVIDRSLVAVVLLVLLLTFLPGDVCQCAPVFDSPTSGGEIAGLDNDPLRWDVPHCEVGAQKVDCETSGISYIERAVELTPVPSGDGKAFRSSLINGPSYPAVLWRRRLEEAPAAAWAEAFEVSFYFLYRPPTTYNNAVVDYV